MRWGCIELGAEPSTPLVNTVPQAGQIKSLGWGGGGVRWGCIELGAEPSTPLVNTVPHAGQIKSLQGKWGGGRGALGVYRARCRTLYHTK